MNNKTVVPISGDDITVLWAAEAELHGNLKSPEEADETQAMGHDARWGSVTFV